MPCRVRPAILLTLGLCVAVAPIARAQTAVGTIEGAVRDPDKRVVPGVTVVVNGPTLPQKNLTVFSGPEGYYRIPLLPPGTYTVTLSLTGFQTIERAGLIVNAGQTTTVDIALRLATVEESVTVVGESPTIDPTSAKLGFNYTQQLLENVPTTRSFTSIVATIPGVENTSPFGFAPGNLEKENVLGAGGYGNRYTMEGTNITDPSVSFNVAALFSPDSIQEVQVIRGAKPAEVGFASGGFFQIVTKSGGNQFSGDVDLLWEGSRLSSTNLSDALRAAGVTRSNEQLNHVDGSLNGGGRIVRDKLWWYGSFRGESKRFHLLGFNPDVQDDTRAYFGKGTYQLNANNRFSALGARLSEKVNYFFFGFAPSLAASPEVSMIRDLGGDMAQAHWDGVLTSNVAVQAGFGYNQLRLNQLFQPNAGVATTDSVTGIRYGDPGSGSRISPSSNYDYTTSLSWFVPDAAGRHDIKVGGEYTHAPFTWGYDQIGDYTLSVQRNVPFSVTLQTTPVNAAWVQNYGSLYAQDAWTIGPLTLNLGARWDRISSQLPPQSSGGGDFANTALADQFPVLKFHSFGARDLWTWNNVAPRLAAAYKVDSAGKTVIRGGFSRYFHHLNAQEVWSVNPNFPTNITLRWSDLNKDGAFQVGEQGTLVSQSGGGLTSYDPNIKQPYSDEVTIGVSQELFPDFNVNVNYIHRLDKNLIYTTSSIPFSSYTPRTIVDAGNDGKVGTADDGTITVYAQDPATLGTDRLLLTNPSASQFGIDPGRTFNAFEIVATKRMSHRWQMVASFIGSRSLVAIPTSEATGALGSDFANPNNVINLRGRDDSNQTYQAKMQGTYMAPWGFMLSGFYRHGSGFPYTRQVVVTGMPQGTVVVFAEPRGSRRTADKFDWVDVRAEKTLTFANHTKVGLFVDVFNLTNAATVFQYGARTGVNLGQPLAVRNPRSARIGARLSW